MSSNETILDDLSVQPDPDALRRVAQWYERTIAARAPAPAPEPDVARMAQGTADGVWEGYGDDE